MPDEWQGYDATPQDQREFPDLAPVRPREARARDGQVQRAQPGQVARPGSHRAPGIGGAGGGGVGGQGYPEGGQRYPQGGQRPQGGGYGADAGAGVGRPAGGGYQGGGYQGGGYPGGGYGGQEQAPPWEPERWPGQPTDVAPPRRHQEPPPPVPQQERTARPRDDDEAPSWAEPDSEEAFTERWHRRGLESQDEQLQGRRKRRRLLIGAVAAVFALAVAATVYLLEGGPGAANLGFGNFVTTFLPGELQQVPDPCTTLPGATLRQYMPGSLKVAAPPLNSGANTECTWTLDSAPTYRVLEVQLQAYSPSGLASGNGSATFAAEDAYESFENGFTSPGPKSGEPKATVTDLSGMPGGSETSAFLATQVFNRGGATTDVANVLVRYRNVIVTVVVDGLDQTSGGKQYGPVAMGDLTAEAKAVASEMAGQIAN